MPISIVTRAEWMAQQPVEIKPLPLPIKDVLFLQTGTKNHMTLEQVVKWLPEYQKYVIDDELRFDIPYNWLVDFNGYIYEGRGWKTNVEKYDEVYGHLNFKSLDIGFIGTFKNNKAPRFMEKVATKLIELGMRQKFIVSTRELTVYNWNSFPST